MTTPPPDTLAYAVTCPTWCPGGHPVMLALSAALPESEWDPLVFHELALSSATALGLEVLLVTEDTHPAGHEKPTPAHLQVWAGGELALSGTPPQLRQIASTLLEAADVAERVRTW